MPTIKQTALLYKALSYRLRPTCYCCTPTPPTGPYAVRVIFASQLARQRSPRAPKIKFQCTRNYHRYDTSKTSNLKHRTCNLTNAIYVDIQKRYASPCIHQTGRYMSSCPPSHKSSVGATSQPINIPTNQLID